jgi:hypothetical protein
METDHGEARSHLLLGSVAGTRQGRRLAAIAESIAGAERERPIAA